MPGALVSDVPATRWTAGRAINSHTGETADQTVGTLLQYHLPGDKFPPPQLLTFVWSALVSLSFFLLLFCGAELKAERGPVA